MSLISASFSIWIIDWRRERPRLGCWLVWLWSMIGPGRVFLLDFFLFLDRPSWMTSSRFFFNQNKGAWLSWRISSLQTEAQLIVQFNSYIIENHRSFASFLFSFFFKWNMKHITVGIVCSVNKSEFRLLF